MWSDTARQAAAEVRRGAGSGAATRANVNRPISGGLPVANNRVAAQTLSSGSKSAPAPVHDGMSNAGVHSELLDRDTAARAQFGVGSRVLKKRD